MPLVSKVPPFEVIATELLKLRAPALLRTCSAPPSKVSGPTPIEDVCKDGFEFVTTTVVPEPEIIVPRE